MNKNTYQVIEDNAGNLFMFVWNEEGEIIFAAEVAARDINNCIADVENAASWDEDTDALNYFMERDELENIEDARQARYDELTSCEYGWNIVADEEGIYDEHMGAAACEAFEIEK